MHSHLFDNGRDTFRALREFAWRGSVAQTPWGVAAYIGPGDAPKPATGREPHPFFGVANGRTWQYLFARAVYADANDVPYELNYQDVVQVREDLGGGFTSYGRHDLGKRPTTNLLFGRVVVRRLSVSEALSSVAVKSVPAEFSDARVTPRGSQISLWETTAHWGDEYRGDAKFVFAHVSICGTRAQLHCPGIILPGWTLENNETATFAGTLETIRDSVGVFAKRLCNLVRQQ